MKTAEQLMGELLREWQRVRMDGLAERVEESKVALNCELVHRYLQQARFDDPDARALAEQWEAKVDALMFQIRKHQLLTCKRFSFSIVGQNDYTLTLRRQYGEVKAILGSMVNLLTPELEVVYASRN